MRLFAFIVILAVIVAIAALFTGYLNVTSIRGRPPELTATRNSVTLKGGQGPAFDVEAGSVKVGTKPATVNLPVVQIAKPQNRREPATGNRM